MGGSGLPRARPRIRRDTDHQSWKRTLKGMKGANERKTWGEFLDAEQKKKKDKKHDRGQKSGREGSNLKKEVRES